jgi:hypothetical protein
MVATGYILILIGNIVSLVGMVMLLSATYKRGVGWFIGCLLFPPAWLALIAFHFGASVRPVTIVVTGLVLTGLGCWMLGVYP